MYRKKEESKMGKNQEKGGKKKKKPNQRQVQCFVKARMLLISVALDTE